MTVNGMFDFHRTERRDEKDMCENRCGRGYEIDTIVLVVFALSLIPSLVGEHLSSKCPGGSILHM